MTVPAIEPVKNHYGNGSATVFDFGFYIENEQQLAVWKTNTDNVDTLLVNGIDYSINEIKNPNGSYITFPLITSSHGVLKNGEVLSIQLNLPIQQESEYEVSDKLNLGAIEYSFDYITRIAQMLARKISRAVKVSEGSSLTADELVQSIFTAYENTKNNADSAKNSVLEAYKTLDAAQNLLKSVDEILSRIETNKSDKLDVISPHALFELVEFDKKLTEVNKIGYGKQNSEISGNDYPDAYIELLNDFNDGVKKVFTKSGVSSYYKHYKADVAGDFYIPYADEIEQGVELFSDTDLSASLGHITQVVNSLVNGFIGSEYDFFISPDKSLENQLEVFEDAVLTHSLGYVSDLKHCMGRKYSCLKSGIVYTKNEELKKGVKLYSDEALTIDRGTITNIGKKYSDKYNVTSLGSVYVDTDKPIGVGSKLYSDVILNTVIATVTEKGSDNNISAASYCYYLRPTFASIYCYLKKPISGEWQPMYTDSACTQRYTYGGAPYMAAIVNGSFAVVKTDYDSGWQFNGICQEYRLVTESTSTESDNYICVDNKNEHLAFSKVGTDSVDVISVNTEPDETYSLEEQYEKDFIEINSSGSYQSYVQTGNTASTLIAIDDGELQNIVFVGAEALGDIVFEYSQSSDGHKIVDSKYKNALAGYLSDNGTSDFYLIDTVAKTFILPLYDKDKNIYVCLANTFNKSAALDILNIIYKELYDADNKLSAVLGE